MPMTTLYDEHIDRFKLIDRKNSWAYSSSPIRVRAIEFTKNKI